MGGVDKRDTTAQKVALYQRILGTYQEDASNTPHVFVFTMDSITLDGTRYAFNPQTDLYFEDEVPEVERYRQKTFYMHFNNDYYPVKFDKNLLPEEEIVITIGDRPGTYIRIAGPSGGGSSEGTGSIDFSLVGDWKYSGGGVSTTLTMSDGGNFSFKKGTGSNHSGNWSLSGNQVTFRYQTTASSVTVDVEDTFTVSGDASSMTLTLVNSKTVTNGGAPQNSTTMSTMLNAFYSIYNSTFVTLTK